MFKALQCDELCLQETHWTDETMAKVKCLKSGAHLSRCVGFFVKERLLCIVRQLSKDKGRILVTEYDQYSVTTRF